MTKAPWYQGDTVDLAFDVNDRSGALKPVSATIDVKNSKNELIYSSTALIEENTVKCFIPPEYTSEAGRYLAIFTVLIPPDKNLGFWARFITGRTIKRTHEIRYRILPKGEVTGDERELLPITDKSTEKEIGQLLNAASRSLRRLGKTADEAAETTEILFQKMRKR